MKYQMIFTYRANIAKDFKSTLQRKIESLFAQNMRIFGSDDVQDISVSVYGTHVTITYESECDIKYGNYFCEDVINTKDYKTMLNTVSETGNVIYPTMYSLSYAKRE